MDFTSLHERFTKYHETFIGYPCNIANSFEDMIQKWQLATQDNTSHIVVIPHVTKQK